MSRTAAEGRRSSRDLLASGFSRTGILRLLELLPRTPQLLVLNYHRIGDSRTTEFDPGVFSTDAAGLDEQLIALKRRFTIVTPGESLDIVEGRYRPREPLALITFDDGYRDNLVYADPILRSHGVFAIFFVVTSYTGTSQLPWWDRLAALVRKNIRNSALPQVVGSDGAPFDTRGLSIEGVIHAALSRYKRMSPADQAHLLEALERGAGSADVGTAERLILDWDDVRALKAAGMSIGVHSHSHRILSQLDPDEQLHELELSKEIVERETGETAHFLAYPDGSMGTYDSASIRAAAAVGFKAAFSFSGGTNLPRLIDQFNVHRCAFAPYARGARLRLAVTTLSSGMTRWI
jgi:peptidoglycan/xylan/chitin deacetylase (PgdA/CDA1 family)